MAAIPQTLQTPSIPNYAYICIPQELLRDLAEMYAAAGGGPYLPLNTFISELVQERIIHFRSLRIRPSLDTSTFNSDDQEVRQTNSIHRNLLSTEQKQQILFLRDDGMSTEYLAKRFHCGISTIKRLLSAYDGRKHNPTASQPGPNRTHGNPQSW